jgi:hypothetical protein
MGFDDHLPAQSIDELPVSIALTPMAEHGVPPIPQVVIEREKLIERIAAQPVGIATGRKTAFTLRLDTNRHVRLRLACAVQGQSAQQIVTQALDTYLDSSPAIARLAQQLPHMRGESE